MTLPDVRLQKMQIATAKSRECGRGGMSDILLIAVHPGSAALGRKFSMCVGRVFWQKPSVSQA